MISKEQIKSITEKCADKGYAVRVRDISFVLLCKHYEDVSVSYQSLFGGDATESEVREYIESPKMKYLKQLVNEVTNTVTTLSGNDMSLTFEENKEALIAMLDKIKTAVSNEELDIKDAMRMEKDIRVALNDKFRVADSTTKQFVIVQAKYNHICEWTRKECFLQTKEYAKKNWNLYEKQEVVDEIRKTYDLIKKQK